MIAKVFLVTATGGLKRHLLLITLFRCLAFLFGFSKSMYFTWYPKLGASKSMYFNCILSLGLQKVCILNGIPSLGFQKAFILPQLDLCTFGPLPFRGGLGKGLALSRTAPDLWTFEPLPFRGGLGKGPALSRAAP